MIEKLHVHEEGPSWKIAERFATFEEANHKRQALLNEEDLQVKVQWMRKRDDFAVKTRANPEIEAERLAQERRELKKRRKLKLQKKRRKK